MTGNDLMKVIGYKTMVDSIRRNISIIPNALGNDPFPLKHRFADGLYIREIFIPKGYFCIGAGHNEGYVNIIQYGDMSIMTEEGIQRVIGPETIISKAGAQRIGYSHEDTLWITVHKNIDNEQNIEVLDKRLHNREYNFPQINTDAGELFDAKKFRQLTESVYRAEKYGLWSDWTETEQEMVKNGDWEGFSRSRNYSEKEIAELREWIIMRKEGELRGINVMELISDLVFACVTKSLLMDRNNEIEKSSFDPGGV